MSEWHCRLAGASADPEYCQGLRHGECGLRYLPGEYSLTGDGIMLPGIGVVAMEGAAFAPKNAPVTIYRDGSGWVAEFEPRLLRTCQRMAPRSAPGRPSPCQPGGGPRTAQMASVH